MNRFKYSVIIGLLILWIFFPCVIHSEDTKTATVESSQKKQSNSSEAQTKSATSSQADTANKAPINHVVYKPPLRGSPAGRVSGGTRGSMERESFSLQVLAPDHIGLTTKEQPCLYWFISKPVQFPVELTIIDRNAVEPLLEKKLNNPSKGGIQSICLADYGVHLKKNVTYKWFVTIITDSSHRSKDILAGGIISPVEISGTLKRKLDTASKNDVPVIYAEEGFWYDAFQSLFEMTGSGQDDASIHQQRASLLEQVGLKEAADFERKQ